MNTFFFPLNVLKIVNPFHFIALHCVVLANKILVNLKLEVGIRLNVKKILKFKGYFLSLIIKK